MERSNYIIIDKLRLIIETTRDLEENSIDHETYRKIFSEKTEDLKMSIAELLNCPIGISLDQMASLFIAGRLFIKMGNYVEELLLAWLRFKKIPYDILSEHSFKEEYYENYLLVNRNGEIHIIGEKYDCNNIDNR